MWARSILFPTDRNLRIPKLDNVLWNSLNNLWFTTCNEHKPTDPKKRNTLRYLYIYTFNQRKVGGTKNEMTQKKKESRKKINRINKRENVNKKEGNHIAWLINHTYDTHHMIHYVGWSFGPMHKQNCIKMWQNTNIKMHENA